MARSHPPHFAQVDPRFLYYTVLTEEFIERVANLQRGASYPAVTDGDVFRQEIALPPLPEQRSIAAVLSKIQAALQVQERIVATLKELKAATMAKLFREGLRGEPLKQTEIGEMPESWQVVPLADVLRLAQYGLSVRGERTGQYPMLRMNCQEDGRVVFRDLQFVDLDETTFSAFRLGEGDLLFNRTNSFELVGRTAIFRGQKDAVFASYLIRLRVDDHAVVPDFLNYYLNLESVQAALKSLATRGVSQSNISASKLKLFRVCVPPREEQVHIVEVLNRLAESLGVAIERREGFKATFSSMLHLLMTGRVRVRTPETRSNQWDPLTVKVERFVGELVRRFEPEQVVLFGSHADGSATADSDVDLLVVMPFEGLGSDQAARIDSALERDFPLDLLVRRPEAVREALEQGDPFMKEIVEKGKVLYARPE